MLLNEVPDEDSNFQQYVRDCLIEEREKLGEAAERAVVGLGSKVGPGWKEKVKEHLTDEAMAGLREHVQELRDARVDPLPLHHRLVLLGRHLVARPHRERAAAPLRDARGGRGVLI